MEVAIQLPDDIAERLKNEWYDLPRRALEGIDAIMIELIYVFT